jgi:chemotaxis protein methyltransferase CheR
LAQQKNAMLSQRQDEIQVFLEGLKLNFSLDFTQYSEASVIRRLSRVCEQLECEDLEELTQRLEFDSNLLIEFLDQFTVNVTEMFRDPFFFQKLLPFLEKDINKDYSIWHPGCSSGEEIISLAILLHRAKKLQYCTFTGTDLNEKVLERATKKWVKRRHISDYQRAFSQVTGDFDLLQYFEDDHSQELRLKKYVEMSAVFEVHDLVSLYWEKGPFDLIVCRNVLIYFNTQLQDKVFSFLLEKLKVGGIIAFGSRESVFYCQDFNQLEILDQDARIFRKIG